jgi:hypothetical protein
MKEQKEERDKNELEKLLKEENMRMLAVLMVVRLADMLVG